jgi:hypothetical protein
MKRITLDTNVVGAALGQGSTFRQKVERGEFQIYVAETTLTLDGLFKQGKVNLLALKEVRHAFKKSRWDDYLSLGLKFLLCPRIGMPRPIYRNDEDVIIEYTYLHRAAEQTYSQEERQSRYFEVLGYIENELRAGKKWLAELQNEIQSVGGNYNANQPWFLNVANNLSQLGESKLRKRFSDWADSDAIASHYAYGNDVFCTNDMARSAGTASIMSATNRSKIVARYGIVFKTLDDLATQ